MKKLVNVARSSMPCADDFIMSASRLTCAGLAYAGSALVPTPLDVAALLVAQTFVIMALWRLIGLVENRIQLHVASFVRARMGFEKSAESNTDVPII